MLFIEIIKMDSYVAIYKMGTGNDEQQIPLMNFT